MGIIFRNWRKEERRRTSSYTTGNYTIETCETYNQHIDFQPDEFEVSGFSDWCWGIVERRFDKEEII